MGRIKEKPGDSGSATPVEGYLETYRNHGWDNQVQAQVVYPPEQHPCPWPDCEYRIAGIAFRLENMGDKALVQKWMSAWWQGPGLLGHCPGCGQLVRFGVQEKKAVTARNQEDANPLPEDWFKRAHLVLR